MKKISAILFSLTAICSGTVAAQDFTVLSTPAEVLANSIENVTGAKETFAAVLDNAASTEDEITTAMQTYMQNADPKPGYGFDMSFLIKYNSVNEENLGKYTQNILAEYWKCDIDGFTFGNNNATFMATSGTSSDNQKYYYMRINYNNKVDSENYFSLTSSYDKFAIYQDVNLSKGTYILECNAYVVGLAYAATLSADDFNSSKIGGRGSSLPAKYSVNFNIDSDKSVKVGLKRNNTGGSLTQIAFNNMYLYKTSSIYNIAADAKGALSATNLTGVDVQLGISYNAEQYYPICLPFIVTDWKEVFEDLLYPTVNNEYADGTFNFSRVAGANTQARKPYLVKFKENIDENNYLLFKNVDVAAGGGGAWPFTNDPVPAKLVGNWAAGTVPANCYYLDGDTWKLSDGTAPLSGFSAYFDATGMSEHPQTIEMTIPNIQSSIVDTFDCEIENAIVNVYNIQGIIVKKGVEISNALSELPAGIYIINGKKIVKH